MNNINVGLNPNDGTGSSLRDAMILINENFIELKTDIENILLQFPIENLDELQDEIDVINSSITAILLQLQSKSDITHTHLVSEILDLQDMLNDLVTSSDFNNQIGDINTSISLINSSISNINEIISDIENQLSQQNDVNLNFSQDLADLQEQINNIPPNDLETVTNNGNSTSNNIEINSAFTPKKFSVSFTNFVGTQTVFVDSTAISQTNDNGTKRLVFSTGASCDLTLPNENGMLATQEWVNENTGGLFTNLQTVIEAGNTADFNDGITSTRLPNDADHTFNISSTNTVSGNNEYFTIFGAEGTISQQVGEYNASNPSYGDRTITTNDINIQLRNNEYTLPADVLQNSGTIDVNNNSVLVQAKDNVEDSTTSINVQVDGLDLISTDTIGITDLNLNSSGFSVVNVIGLDTKQLSFNTSGLGINTNNVPAMGYIKSDNLTADVTIQIPSNSGEIALQENTFFSPNIQITNAGGNLVLTNDTSSDLILTSAGVQVATLGYSGLNLNRSAGVAGNINVDDLTGSKTYNLPNANGKLVVVSTTAPASATALGVVGEIRVTSSYIYTCIATNTWVRSAMSTW